MIRIPAYRTVALVVLALAGAATGLGCADAGVDDGGAATGVEPAAASPAPGGDPTTDPAPGRQPASPAEALGTGFVTWESRRSGAWRIWIRDLDGSPRQLSPDEPGRWHCCAHIGPDGREIVYASLAGAAPDTYPQGGVTGTLHLVHPDGSGHRRLVDAVRTYDENRTVVWRSPEELIFIDEAGHSRILRLADGSTEKLTARPAEGYGWLFNRQLTHATTGQATFSPFRRATGRIDARTELGGCQPYFSDDGRWGFWMAGAGGPIERIDLESRQTATVLAKSDPRLPDGFGYIYFPMLSRDGHFLAFAASDHTHDHFRADYEVFLVETDPDTFEVVGEPVRITHHRSTDRFPDVWVAPLALGRHRGEAPLRMDLEVPADRAAGEWQWSVDGKPAGTGPSLRTELREAGTVRVAAQRDGETLEGLVRVSAPRPPAVLAVESFAGGRELRVLFDEPIRLAATRAALASGIGLGEPRVAESGRALVLPIAEPLTAGDLLDLAGVSDTAQEPNTIEPLTLEVSPPSWPMRSNGLVFLWRSADAANLIFDTALDAERATSLTASGRARLDHAYAMVLGGGRFAAPRDDLAYAAFSARGTNQVTVELALEPYRQQSGEIVSFGTGRGRRNFALRQEKDRLHVVLLLGGGGARGERSLDVARLATDRPTHLVVTYRPGNLTVYGDGQPILESRELTGDFFHWRPRPLIFGDGNWAGTIEHVAIYSRELGPAEAAENARRFHTALRTRPHPPTIEATARRLESSPAPTLAEISPYRQALAVHTYRIEAVAGEAPAAVAPGAIVRVAEWAILDGETQAPAAGGTPVRLALQPYADQPQLERVVVSDRVEGGGPLYFRLDR